MKHYIRETARKHGFEAEWEVKISDDFTHIADVVIYFNDLEKNMFNSVGIAVECQCSSITVEEYDERNDTYLNKGLTPWWIFGGKYSERIDPDSDFEERHITKIQRRNNEQVNGWSYHYKNQQLRISNFIGRTKTKGHYRDITTTDFLSAIKVISGHLYEPYLSKYRLIQQKRVGCFYRNGDEWISISELINHLDTQQKIIDQDKLDIRDNVFKNLVSIYKKEDQIQKLNYNTNLTQLSRDYRKAAIKKEKNELIVKVDKQLAAIIGGKIDV